MKDSKLIHGCVTSRTSQSSTQALASNFGGDTVTMQSGRDTTLIGSNIVGDNGTTLIAQGNLNILAGTNTSSQSDYKREEKSGFFSSGGFGITIGSQEQSQDQKTTSTSSAATTVGSIKGNVNLSAGKTYQQTGSDVLTPKGDINISAKQVNILAARETQHSTVDTEFHQSGLTISLSTPILNAIQSIDQMSQAASKTSNTRMKVLAAGSAGLSAYNAYNQVVAGQGSRINGIDNQIPTGKTNPDNTPETRDATAMDKVGGIDIAVSFGSSSSESHSVQQANQARGSTISAGGNLTISATGAGANSNLLIEGGQLSAGKNIALAADNAITLKAAQSTSEQHSSNNASSGSVGFSVGTSGFIANAAFSKSKGKGDGSDVTNTLTHVNAGNQLTITSGSDTNLQGAVVAGKQVTMDVGTSGKGNLNIESVQDLSTYQGRQESFGGSFSFGAGKPAASINIGRGKVDGSYASVIEQSGVVAGDGGFNIKVNGNTDLKGAKIASTEQAASTGKNSLTTNTLTQSNIQNKDSYQAESTSASFGGGGSMGYGSSSSSASSVTESGISAGKVTIKDDAAQQAKTGKSATETIASINTKVTEKDSSGKLSKDWNGQQLMEDVTAQAQIMQSFGSQAAKAIGDYALKKENEIRGKLEKETDPQKQAELNVELKSWEEGGSNRVLLHTAAGALSGGLGGALGAGVSAATMPKISELINEMDLPAEVKKDLKQVTSTALGAIVGGNSGAATSLNVDSNNRELHPDEKMRIKKLANGDPEKEARLTAAACAAVKCYAQYPVDSLVYKELRDIAVWGDSADLAVERKILKYQQGLFGYDISDAISDGIRRYQVPNRTIGAVQGVTGAAVAAGAISSGCATIVACSLGVTIAATNLDYSKAGFEQLINGNLTPTYGEKALQSLGLSPEAASLIYGTVNFGASVGNAVLLNKAWKEAIDLSNQAKLTYTPMSEFGAKGLQVTPEILKTPQAQAITKEYIAAGVSPNNALEFTAQLLETGKKLPTILPVNSNTELIKIMPKSALGSDSVGTYSPFFMTRQEYDALSKLPVKEIVNKLGLPAEQAIRGSQLGFDVYSMKPIAGAKPTVFSSEVAPVQQGKYFAQGGAQQVLVPNRNQWTDPNANKIGTIK